MNKYLTILISILIISCNGNETTTPTNEPSSVKEDNPVSDTLRFPQEKHLKNIRQLTFGGDNAEAYFSFDNKSLVLQITNPKENIPCDQIFYGKIPTDNGPFDVTRVSNGEGRTTCAYFLPGDKKIIYASTYLSGKECPPIPDMRKLKKYVWPVYNTFEIFVKDLETGEEVQLTDNDYYDAEATVSPDGKKVVFTSTRSGDLELYTMDLDGSNVQQVTTGLGYDGGAFFTPDSKQLIFRASRPQTEEEQKEYKDLLSQGLVAPTNMELYICNADGSDLRQITHLGKANWAPFMHPSGKKVIFSSNHASESGREFNLFMVNLDGTGLEQITYDAVFAAFPMFSYDGKYLVFASNRNNGGGRDTNLFIAEWVD
jgi:TolB protein